MRFQHTSGTYIDYIIIHICYVLYTIMLRQNAWLEFYSLLVMLNINHVQCTIFYENNNIFLNAIRNKTFLFIPVLWVLRCENINVFHHTLMIHLIIIIIRVTIIFIATASNLCPFSRQVFQDWYKQQPQQQQSRPLLINLLKYDSHSVLLHFILHTRIILVDTRRKWYSLIQMILIYCLW